RKTPHGWRLGLGAGALLLALPFAAMQPHSATSAASTPAAGAVPTVNWALSGSATATTAESRAPASGAVDGDAGTDWCTSGWTGTLTVDLGRARALSDLGITLDSASPSASAAIQLATTAGNWQPARALRNLALDPGHPMYFPLPRNTTARYAQLT